MTEGFVNKQVSTCPPADENFVEPERELIYFKKKSYCDTFLGSVEVIVVLQFASIHILLSTLTHYFHGT